MPVAPLTSLLVRAKLPFLVLQGPCRTGIPSFCRRSALGLKGVAFGCHQHHVVGCRCTCALKGHSLPRHRRLPCPDLLALCADKTVCVRVCVCVCVCACVRACVWMLVAHAIAVGMHTNSRRLHCVFAGESAANVCRVASQTPRLRCRGLCSAEMRLERKHEECTHKT